MDAQALALVVFVSFWGSVLLVLTHRFHSRWTSDVGGAGIQKHHLGAPSRVGGVPIVLAVGLGAWLWGSVAQSPAAGLGHMVGLLMLASIPAVGLGLADDLFKRVSPRVRISGAALASVLAMLLLDARIVRIGVPGLDDVVALWPVSVLVTVLMVSGFTNAVNIVDGLNGLAGGLALMMAAATGFVAWQLGDALLFDMCTLLGAALLGFFLVNFPRGALFLGDGGAYFIGFALAQIWILLVARHPDVSPWIVMAIAFHPTMETIFSIARRRWLQRRKGAAMLADRLHLHSLVYRRATLQWLAGTGAPRWVGNALAAAATIVFGCVPMVLAVSGPRTTWWGAVVLALGVVAYLWAFRRFVRFAVGVAPAAWGQQPELQSAHDSAR